MVVGGNVNGRSVHGIRFDLAWVAGDRGTRWRAVPRDSNEVRARDCSVFETKMMGLKVSGQGKSAWYHIAWKRTGRVLNVREVTQAAGRFKWSVGRKLSSPATALQVWLSAVFKVARPSARGPGKGRRDTPSEPCHRGQEHAQLKVSKLVHGQTIQTCVFEKRIVKPESRFVTKNAALAVSADSVHRGETSIRLIWPAAKGNKQVWLRLDELRSTRWLSRRQARGLR